MHLMDIIIVSQWSVDAVKISMVTISFNQHCFLERAIRSVLDQSHNDIQYIIVDPGSTDGSRDLIEAYRDRLGGVVFEPDKGPADGLNKGFALATGDVCGYLNADDVLLPGCLEKVADLFTHHPDVDIFCGDGYMADAEGNPLKRVRSTSFSPWWFVHGGALVLQQSTFFRRQAFLDVVGGFNIQNRTSWDAELVLDMIMAGNTLRVVHEPWSLFTLHDDSITGSQRLAEESRRQHARYFKKVMGRERTPMDVKIAKLGRVRRWISDPLSLVYRLQDAISRPRLRI